jgi:hypothetical protein
MRLLRQVFDKQRRHRAFEADMQFRNDALGECHDLYAGKRHLLMEAGDVLLVPAQAVQRLGQHHLEAAGAGVGDQLLELRS